MNLFVRPPGDLLYFLAIVAISLAGLFMVLGQRLNRPEDRGARRYMIALAGVVAAWIFLMAGALLVLTSQQNARTVLPPLERAATVLSILLLSWAFLTAEDRQRGALPNVLLLMALVTTVIGYVVTASTWMTLAEQVDFNISLYGISWTFAAALLCAASILLVLFYFRRVIDAPLKLVFFVVLLIGYVAVLLQGAQGTLVGDYAGASRLAFLAALPFVPALLYRMILRRLEQELGRRTVLASVPTPAASAALRPVSTGVPSPVERESAMLLKALGLMLEEVDPIKLPRQVVLTAIEVLKVDIGAVLTLQDANYADILFAYDNALKREFPGMLSLNLDDQPTLVNAIERSAQRPLYSDRNVNELTDLYTRLDISKIGPTYFQPFVRNREVIAVLMVGMPYSERELRDAELELLKGMSVIASALLALSMQARNAKLLAEERTIQAMVQGVTPKDLEDAPMLAARQEMQVSLQMYQSQVKNLTRQVGELQQQLEMERNRVASDLGETQEGFSISQRMLVLNEEQQRLRTERDALTERLKQAETMLAGASAVNNESMLSRLIDVLRRDKDELLAERDYLQAQLEASQRPINPSAAEAVNARIQQMEAEQATLQAQRDDLQERLTDVERQLMALGIEGGTRGLTQLITQLYEQRTILQTANQTLKMERDTLLSERERRSNDIDQAQAREEALTALRSELEHIAADREALGIQRDKLRAERDELNTKLETIKQHRTKLLAQVDTYKTELAEAHDALAQLRADLLKTADERALWTSERTQLLAERQALQTDVEQLLARADGDRQRLRTMSEEGVGSLAKMIESLSYERGQLERQLNEAQTQLAAMQDRLSQMQLGLQAEAPATDKAREPELLMSLVQELRTPMTSISGYIKLLLSETPGIIGEMQRKFLLRVTTNILRLETMLNELIRVAALDSGNFSLTPEPIELVMIIDQLLTNAAPQFREKGISVNLRIADDLPALVADRDAVTQIIGELLTNAYLVSPPDSEIAISARRFSLQHPSNDHREVIDAVCVAVEDRGGGIAIEDQARVFARKYRAENPLIQGLGDTGVGLSVARTLVEAHGGRLWLDSRPTGSIFSFALPIHATLVLEGQAQ